MESIIDEEIKSDIQLSIFLTALIALLFLAVRLFPAKKVRYWGYRTPQAFKSQAHWDLAQRHAGAVGTLIFFIILIIELGLYFIKGPTAEIKKTITLMMLLSVGSIILSTEIELWKLTKRHKQRDKRGEK